MSTKSTDIVPAAETGEIVLYDAAMFPDLTARDPRDVQASFTRRFAKATSLDDLFDVLEGNNTRGMVGRKIEVREVAWQPYESDDGVIPLAIVTAADLDSGELMEFATTSGFITLFIRMAEILGELPFKAKVTEKKTRSGKMALNLARV